jgi:heme O synthase-like polyprenyltransferase
MIPVGWPKPSWYGQAIGPFQRRINPIAESMVDGEATEAMGGTRALAPGWLSDRAQQPRTVRGVLADYLSLTKPGVMSLLLVTEFLAMVTAARGFPGWGLSAAALAGGAMASGGASAINCWFDRDIDAVMGRTRDRPVPSGRIAPSSAVGFGLLLTVGAFLTFFALVNPLAAVLSLAGGAFYVLVYTFWLKRATKENIVIGGAAGAVPPLVGWAAVTHGVGPVMMTIASCLLAIWLGPLELLVALGLGLPFLLLGLMVFRDSAGNVWARRLFLFSIAYLFLFFLGTAAVSVFGR